MTDQTVYLCVFVYIRRDNFSLIPRKMMTAIGGIITSVLYSLCCLCADDSVVQLGHMIQFEDKI